MKRQFKSQMAEIIKAFIEQKHSVGYKYHENERYLLNFDEMCATNFPSANTVTKEVALAWAASGPNENRAGLARRISPVRELSRYIIRSGKNAYIIPKQCGKTPFRNFVPYIFTKEELSKIFEAADNLPPLERFPLNHLEAPIMIRLLYACGLRPYEGREILRKNIDLDKGTIFIPESKKFKDRIVVMDNSMLEMCRIYDEKSRIILPSSNYFFPCHGKIHSYHNKGWLNMIMDRCLLNSGVYDNVGIKPRPYDLRHTYATHTLFRWLEEGRDLNNCLPYLSAFMGHEKFQHTAYYIHLVPECLPNIQANYVINLTHFIPEVPHED